jgi:membrane protein YdbS with pleckstrin-like domain
MLGDGETILAEGRQHWMALIRFALQPILVFLAAIGCLLLGTWLTPSGDGLFNDIFRWIDTLLGLLTLGLFILAVVWFPIQVLRWIKRRFLVTDRRVLYVEGLLRRNSRDAGMKMITDVGFRQTFLGRRMGFGDLTIATAANRPLHFREMRDAVAFKKVIMAAQMGTIEKRADEILGKPAAVPSVAAVATAIDPESFPPPTPAWDGSDVPEMAEDDIPPADPEIFGTVAATTAEPVTGAATPATDATIAVPAAAVVEPVTAAAVAATADDEISMPVADVAVVDVAATEAATPVVEAAPVAPVAAAEAPAAALADIDSVIAAPETEAATGAAAVTEALARLADLRDSGAITEEDFEAKKQDLLDRL